VLGASVSNVVALLSKDFVVLVGIALLIASPVSWLLMQQWLEDYAYLIAFGPDIFMLAGAALLCITLLTISFQAIKAALANPTKSLRIE
jgi:putative ABC transport system permease protein